MDAFEPRTYRRQIAAPGLRAFRLVVGETDLHIQVAAADGAPGVAGEAPAGIRELALAATKQARQAIETEIVFRRDFRTSLAPLPVPGGATGLVRAMYDAAQRAGVGPMAAVAGAVAEHVGRRLAETCAEVIVENGGDIFLSGTAPRTVAVLAGRSPLSNKLGIKLPPVGALGVCTSSGTVGPSFSAGKADAALIIAADAAFSDAMASALGNRVRVAEDIQPAVEWAMTVPGVRQALVVMGDALGVAGEFELTGL